MSQPQYTHDRQEHDHRYTGNNLDLPFIYDVYVNNFHSHTHTQQHIIITAITHITRVSALRSIFTSLIIISPFLFHSHTIHSLFTIFFPHVPRTAFHSFKTNFLHISDVKQYMEERKPLCACAESSHPRRCTSYDIRNEQKLHQRMWNLYIYYFWHRQ